MSITPDTDNSLLIVGLTPQFLEKPVVWFEEHQAEIAQARITNRLWRDKTLVINEGSTRKLSEFLRELHDIGYVTVITLEHPGELTRTGGTITIFPINTRHPWQIEFVGNTVESLIELPKIESKEEQKSPEAIRLLKKSKLEWLRAGDFVVHTDHGIGIYRGIVTKNDQPYLALAYAAPQGKDAKADMLFVPEELAGKISAYIGFRTPSLHRLGTPAWEHTKKRVREDVIKLAQDLLRLYAERALVERPPYEPVPELEDQLAAGFAHDETPDQTTASEEILIDMTKRQPMDRLLLADVGFGKTEIAIRAALRAALNSRQVAIICPTTILCDQHFETFRERLKDFPVTIARLSRLDSKSAQRETLKKLAAGSIDIIIATHRALSKDVAFKNLGLLVLDEEQRFGVKQKEHLKNIQHGIDVLSLSATPIPRTLNLALSRLREMSTISTPPPARVAPKTFVLPYSTASIKSALEAEISRKGQAYFLCNHIHKIPLAIKNLQKMLPYARIAAIHGRMSEEAIIGIMHAFREHTVDILVSTTIIENGLDISNANTLIVQDASRIGLSQAHQLRGRIGRSTTQSYAYFLYPARHLKEKAEQRLDALFRTQYLGSGQDIAMRDLEIRGAGNILGRDQSGRINQIGFNLYCQMLAETVEQLRR
jgi:transcription-repair coupling factor (superfamily II helicase)